MSIKAVGGPRGDARPSDDREYPDLAAGGELIVDEIHRPCLIDLARIHATFTQLRLHPPLGGARGILPVARITE